jgi:hypothetical protein
VNRQPLHHIVRVRQSDDLTFVRPGLMDEIIVNANQLENSPDSTATSLRQTALPFTVDPVLWRFQNPKWWRNEKGETKKNYTRLGAAYVRGTSIQIAAGPLLQTVPSDKEWAIIASNVIDYQRTRLERTPTQLDLFNQEQPRELRPVRLLAPALVAFSADEDRINRLLAEASADAAGTPIALPVIVPLKRLLDAPELARLLLTVPTDRISSYFVWTPNVTEELLLNQDDVLAAILRLISALADRKIPVGHLHATYAIAALLTSLWDALRPPLTRPPLTYAVVHHLGWIDKGEPAEPGGGLRSCQTYVPGVRHCVRFERAHDLGRSLDAAAYAERYCDCAFCTGSFDNGQHPLDLMLEDQLVMFKNGRERRTPTGRALAPNTWHYLLSRRLEVQAFSDRPAVDVLHRDMQRAAALAGGGEMERLRRLANRLPAA